MTTRERARALRRQHVKLSVIADELGVSVPRVHFLVRDLPEHAEAVAQQNEARRLYPKGSQRLRWRLTAAGFSPAERLAECRAAFDTAPEHA